MNRFTEHSKLPKLDPAQFSEIGELSSEIKSDAGIKVSEVALPPTSECDKTFSESTGCGGGGGGAASSASPPSFKDPHLSSAVELSNEGALELGTESQRSETDQTCEQIDKSSPKEEEEDKLN